MTETALETEHKQTWRQGIAPVFAIVCGCAMTLVLQGYQFGRSNHMVYLLDALRADSPGLLKNDWFMSGTLQYHAVFGWLTRALMRASVLSQGFLAGYLLLLVGLHAAWYAIVIRLNATRWTYPLSVLFFHISAAGTGLGMYQFLQDSCFLPSNVANIAMLSGIYFYMVGKYGWAGLWLGVAGAFHLNDAVVVPVMWGTLSAWRWWREERILQQRPWWLGTAAAIGLSGINVALALKDRPMAGAEGLPLNEFVDLYVRLRHPHHYQPSSWPIALWVSFLWPAPLAVVVAIQRTQWRPWRRGIEVTAFFLGLLGLALVGAGIWYVSETLVQMSLWRFSIYPKLMFCIGAAWWCMDWAARQRWRAGQVVAATAAAVAAILVAAVAAAQSVTFLQDNRQTLVVFAAVCAILAIATWASESRPTAKAGVYAAGTAAILALVTMAWTQGAIGFHVVPEDDAAYVEMCRWVRDNTPEDAVFLVPPGEQAMRLVGRRAIVVDFKAVPQLSNELAIWRDRLKDVLEMADLTKLPHPFAQTLQAIDTRYESLPPERLAWVAGKYGARYIVVDHRLGSAWENGRVLVGGNEGYFLYDLARLRQP